AAKTEIVRIAARFDRAELHWGGNAIRCNSKPIENRPSGIPKPEQLGDFVVRFAGGIVARLADSAIVKCPERFVGLHFIQNGVSTGNDEADGGQFRFATAFVRFEKNSVDMTLKMIYRHQR